MSYLLSFGDLQEKPGDNRVVAVENPLQKLVRGVA
jgi:hypothetical protein